MIDITLKFPSGEFTHTELATFNGKTNQQVWIQYQAAIQQGIIISAGVRPPSGGRGKPSKVWKLAVASQASTTPVSPSIPTKTEPVIKPITIIEINPPTVKPKAKEITIDDIKIQTPVERHEPVVKSQSSNAFEINHLCPICKHKLMAVEQGKGVYVWCVQNAQVCLPNDNPFGFERNENEAYRILCEKYKPNQKK